MPWFKLFAADFLADVAELGQAETSAFIRLKATYWHNGGLPDDDDRLRRIAHMTVRQWNDSCGLLAEMFDPGWRDEYLDSAREKSEQESEKRAESGRRGGIAKAERPCDGMASA